MSNTLRGADVVARSLRAYRLPTCLHVVRQPHHVDLRCRAGCGHRPRSRAARSRRRAHGRRPWPPDRRSRRCLGHRRTRSCQRGRSFVHRAGRGIADGSAVGTRRDLGDRARRISGIAPGRDGQAGDEGVLDGRQRRIPRQRYRRGDPYRVLRAARPGSLELAVGFTRCAVGRECRDVAGRRAGNARGAWRCGLRQDSHRPRRRKTSDHLRRSANVECARTRSVGKARSCEQARRQ